MASSLIPVRSGDLLSAQSAKALHRLITTKSSFQAAAAAAATPADFLTLGMAPIVGIVALDIQLEAALGTGESVTYTISRFNVDGTFTTIATVVASDTTAVGRTNVLAGVVGGVSLDAGDVLLIARAYVAGGGATAPGNALIIQVE